VGITPNCSPAAPISRTGLIRICSLILWLRSCDGWRSRGIP